MADYPKSKGGLWLNAQKAGERHPDLRGHIHVSPEQIQMLIAMGQSGQEVKLQLAGWQRVSQANQAYIYVEGEAFMRQPDQQQPQGAVAPQMMPQQPQVAPQQPPQPAYQQPQVPMPQQPAQPQYQQPANTAPPQVPQTGQPAAYPPQPQTVPQQQDAPPDFSDDDIPF